MTPVRLGAVGYLNARPLVYGLERDPRFAVRYDVPAECARLLHAGETDLGLIPSIEHLRGPRPYMLVPGPAVTSKGPVASVAIYTRRDPTDVRTIAMDSSSRTSVALATILMRRVFGSSPEPVSMKPNLDAMLQRADAALIIGDTALFLAVPEPGTPKPESTTLNEPAIQKLDLGELWTRHTGLPFVYAFWSGWPDALTPDDVEALQRARDEGVAHVDEIAAEHFAHDAAKRDVVRRYLRDNIRYYLDRDELEGLKTFYGYASEAGLATFDGSLRMYTGVHQGAR